MAAWLKQATVFIRDLEKFNLILGSQNHLLQKGSNWPPKIFINNHSSVFNKLKAFKFNKHFSLFVKCNLLKPHYCDYLN